MAITKTGIGYGTTFGYDVSGGTTFTTITNVREINFSGLIRAMGDVSHLANDDGFDEFIPGMVNPGEIRLSIVWNPDDTTHAELWTQATAAPNSSTFINTNAWRPPNWQIALNSLVFATNNALRFRGYVNGFTPPTVTRNEGLIIEVSIKATTKPVWADVVP